MFNDRLEQLLDSPFVRLSTLLEHETPPVGTAPLLLSVGEPQGQPPGLLADTLTAHAGEWNRYPPVPGTPALRNAIASWLRRRYDLPEEAVDPDRHLVPTPGSKQPLFMLANLATPERKDGAIPAVLMPNPLYHVYYGAARAAAAEPIPLMATAETGFLPDLDSIDARLWRRTALFYLCSPSNPQGAVADRAYLARAIELARAHDVLLVVDECYSEIHRGDPPPGAMEVCHAMGGGFANVVVCHSLSKRSSAPGLRGGFVAGDPEVVRRLVQLMNYGGVQVPVPVQAACAALWDEEQHVGAVRRRYDAAFAAAEAALGHLPGYRTPPGGFFLWLDVGDGETATVRLWREAAVRVVPGSYLSLPDAAGRNPGDPFIRVALVHTPDVIAEAAQRMARVLDRRGENG